MELGIGLKKIKKALIVFFILILLNFGIVSVFEFVELPKYDLEVNVTMDDKLLFNYSGVEKENYVLLIHGLGSSSDVWEKSKDYLQQDVNVIQVDLYGHVKNDSVPMDKITIQNTADEIIYELNQKCISKIDIVGHSLGGIIAIDIALKQSKLVDKLTLVDTPTKQTGFKLMNYLFLELIKKDYETIIKEHYKKMTKNEEILMELKEIALKTNKYSYYQYMKSLFESDYSSCIEDLDKEKVYLLFSQTLVPKDKYLHKTLRKYGYSTIKNENIYFFNDVGHFIMKEKEKEFNKCIKEILMKEI